MARAKKPKRRHRNLVRLFDKVNELHFGGTVCGGIGWRYIPIGEASVTQATCTLEERFIKVNTLLDDSRVPMWYLEFVVFHEMLHLHLGHKHYTDDISEKDHTPRFNSLEKRHPKYERACEYEEKKLPYIASCWRRWREHERRKRNL